VQLVDCLDTFGGESKVSYRLGRHRVAEAAKHQLSLALDLAGHQPLGNNEPIWLERRERLGTAEAGIVGHARRRGELGRTVGAEHEDADAEARAPSEGVEADHAGSVENDETAESMSGPVIAPRPTMWADAVVNFEGTTLDDDSHAEAVDDTDACDVGAAVGLGERRHGVGDVLGDEHERRRNGRGAHCLAPSEWASWHAAVSTPTVSSKEVPASSRSRTSTR
jgi:hypothetical protein